MKMTSVSVIVATYRRYEELKNALNSLGKQTFCDFEIIVVDDNDNQNWNEKVKIVVEDFKKNYPNAAVNLIVNSPNQGSAVSRNIGINAACGKYITFLDDDDVYLPLKLEKQYNYMEENEADYCITDLYLYDQNDKLVDKRVRKYIKDNSYDELLKNHLKYHLTGTDTFMFKKEYIDEIGCFDAIDVGDEFYLMHKAINGKGKFAYMADCDVKAYIHYGDEGLSSGKGKIDGENKLYEYKKQYFKDVDKKTIRYIKMRHFAVLAFAELRMKNIKKAVFNGIKSFISSPLQLIKLLLGRKI